MRQRRSGNQRTNVSSKSFYAKKDCSLLFYCQLGLQLPVSGLFVIHLQPGLAFGLGIARSRTLLLQGAAEHRGHLRVARLARQGRSKAVRRRRILSGVPQCATKIEVVIGIRVVAFEGFTGRNYLYREEFTSRIWATRYDFPAIKDGRVKREVVPDDSPAGAQGWFMNTRRKQFRDPRVREALICAFDFEWTNKTIMYGAYARTISPFQNSTRQKTR